MISRKIAGIGLAAATILSVTTGATGVLADENINNLNALETNLQKSQDPLHFGKNTTRISTYVFETMKSDTAKEVGDLESIQVDFTDATFYDENGNEVNKDKVVENINKEIEESKDPIQTFSTWREGGSWTSGSGYSSCKGTAIHGLYSGFELVLKADYTSVKGNYDQIDRIYSVNWAGVGNFSLISQGIFRAKEQSGCSAYGGAKGAWNFSNISKSLYLYFRVGNDTAWIDSNM
ncbi:hypothetical protein [Enterococcus thailandicus]|uniref:hypothetical protein n=1 Tax=Enterococcus thailandicus TaxID=417368 RepID=UPI0022EBA63B|nr:hypothetical protein [Enterococcus thailandicus]MDA3965887.1 hypothetical protein [Enterococcus thailandicus]